MCLGKQTQDEQEKPSNCCVDTTAKQDTEHAEKLDDVKVSFLRDAGMSFWNEHDNVGPCEASPSRHGQHFVYIMRLHTSLLLTCHTFTCLNQTTQGKRQT